MSGTGDGAGVARGTAASDPRVTDRIQLIMGPATPDSPVVRKRLAAATKRVLDDAPDTTATSTTLTSTIGTGTGSGSGYVGGYLKAQYTTAGPGAVNPISWTDTSGTVHTAQVIVANGGDALVDNTWGLFVFANEAGDTVYLLRSA